MTSNLTYARVMSKNSAKLRLFTFDYGSSLLLESRPIYYSSFSWKKPSSEHASQVKKRNTRSNTKHEVMLRARCTRWDCDLEKT